MPLTPSLLITAVVTGANKGIGFEICRHLLKAQVSVILTGRNLDRGQKAVNKLKKEFNNDLILGFVQLDVGDEESVAASFQPISDLTNGTLNILVNNAGAAYKDNHFSKEAAYETINVNTFGTMRTTRVLLPLLKNGAEKSVGGRIVNVASIESSLHYLSDKKLQKRFLDDSLTDSAIVELMEEFINATSNNQQKKLGWGGTMYHASKLGQLAFARTLAKELQSGKSAVTVASCCPGFVKTDMSSFCYGPGQGIKTPEEGADTPAWLALMFGEDALESHGRFFSDREMVSRGGYLTIDV